MHTQFWEHVRLERPDSISRYSGRLNSPGNGSLQNRESGEMQNSATYSKKRCTCLLGEELLLLITSSTSLPWQTSAVLPIPSMCKWHCLNMRMTCCLIFVQAHLNTNPQELALHACPLQRGSQVGTACQFSAEAHNSQRFIYLFFFFFSASKCYCLEIVSRLFLVL